MNCLKCNDELTDENWWPNRKAKKQKYCKSCLSVYSKTWAKKNVVKRRLANKYETHQLKIDVLTRYSRLSNTINKVLLQGSPCCVKCGFTDIRALTLDLINGGHKKSRLPYGTMLYRKLRAEKYPKGWQVLCCNCQSIKVIENNECKVI